MEEIREVLSRFWLPLVGTLAFVAVGVGLWGLVVSKRKK